MSTPRQLELIQFTFSAKRRSSLSLVNGAKGEHGGTRYSAHFSDRPLDSPDRPTIVHDSVHGAAMTERQKRAYRRNLRPIAHFGEIATITLTRGHVAVIDAADVPLVCDFNWYVMKKGRTTYAARSVRTDSGLQLVLLHRALMASPEGMDVDHIDGDGLNNRRANLRVCTHRENLGNKRVSLASKTGLKGVWKTTNGFRATIRAGGRSRHLGPFPTAEEAADAYLEAAREFYGEFARGHDD